MEWWRFGADRVYWTLVSGIRLRMEEDQNTDDNIYTLVANCAVAVFLFVLGLLPILAHADLATTSASNEGLEQAVHEYFADTPIMIDIARCESEYRQYDAYGGVLHGGLADGMIGLFQLYERIHYAIALPMGYDIDTPQGNMAYARYLYEEQGTTPWLSSSPCWGKTATTLTKNLSLGMVDSQVRILQQILNARGYAVADAGPGSIGQETDKYGALTREAVRAFQCKQGIACSGSEDTNGYGSVGQKTRTVLLALAIGTSTTYADAKSR